ncbi:hypothetical protein [Roseofilum casamattae]|uniref:Uncharacterized protein n=1 Tax=Roseofilum casamattae BLCC-M143 TaxID=3022442 RepID=A0ABT7C0J0_9CYAN|nr:hypothetical protein [Roseofilum casamattae]MDJ1184028.1 hypothetical protein [Roseofilum casamattae BLCC-M143]
MKHSQRYPFTAFDTSLGEAGFKPYLPITLTYRDRIARSPFSSNYS